MNIQIFGKQKCFGTKAAERFFKERKIKYQSIDINDKGLSMRELESVILCLKDIDLLFNKKSPLYEKFNVAYIRRSIDSKKELLIENPSMLATPIVRDCEAKKATVGAAEAIWKSWI